jgi:uncharacterized protein
MSEENVEALRRIFESFNSGELARILACIDPDFEAEIPAAFSAEPDTYRGHEGVRRYLQSFRDAMSEIRFQPQRFWDAGESVVVDVRLTARGRRTEIPVEQRLAQVWSIRDGRAMAVRTYASIADALAAAGLAS